MGINRIIQLDPFISNQIAAGEVVERPASVVKELVENSLDARATKIEIEIEGGGVHLIRVRDNGHGIVKEDLPLAFSRHATSKITCSEDLAKITSLGFRGEALASIGSVSKSRLISRIKGASEAWQVDLHPHLPPTLLPVAHLEGTTIEIADLFYNTPVRRKFLRSEKAENLAIEDMIKRLALSAPEVAFTIRQNQKARYYPVATTKQGEAARIGKINGQTFIESAVALEFEVEGLSLRGWLGQPKLCRRQADSQYFFVNHRIVKDRVINHAIKLLFQEHPEYSEGTHPAYVLFLNLDPADVDVNVHPTKQEVRFSQSRLVHDFISSALREAWCTTPNVPALLTPSRMPLTHFRSEEKKDNLVTPKLEKRYLCIEKEEGIYIIDFWRSKHALIYHYFERHLGRIAVKPLLFPLKITKRLANNADKIIGLLRECGFDCKRETHSIILLQQPACIEEPLSEKMFEEILESISQHKTVSALLNVLASLLSFDVVKAVDWTTFDVHAIPSVFLTHEDIENTAKV